MLLNIYSIYDEAAGAYATPFFMHNHGLATRAFADQVNNKESMIYNHPEQFILFHLGEYDDRTGEINTESVSLGRGIEYKDKDTNLDEFKLMLNEFQVILNEYKKIDSSPILKGVK